MLKKLSGLLTVGLVTLSTIGFQAISDDDLHRAVIVDLKNKVELKFGASEWRTASINQLVRPGTTIRTGALSKVELKYPDGTITRIGSRTNLSVLDKAQRSIKVASGKVWFKVTKKSIGYRVYSPTAVAAITGTEGFVEYADKDAKDSFLFKPRFADKNGVYKVSEGSNEGFGAGLVEGSMDVFPGSDDNGNPTGSPMPVNPGEILTFQNGGFNLSNVGVESIFNQYNDISSSDQQGNNNNSGSGNSGNKNGNNGNSGNNGGNNGNNGGDANGNNGGNNGNTGDQGGQSISNQPLNPTNPTTEQVPSGINKQQDLNTSPTTGDLEIIIK